MVNPSSRPLRARNAEEKQRRRDDILKAAEDLWQRSSYAELSMNQVAREAQLAKGTLYLYFDTKEELFLVLLQQHLHGWLTHMLERVQEQSPTTGDDVAELLIDLNRDSQPLRRLLLLLGCVLHGHVQPESTQAFRQLIRQDIRDVIEALPFPPELIRRVFLHCYAASVGWHQATEITPLATDTSHLLNPRYALEGNISPKFETEFALTVRLICRELLSPAAIAAAQA